MLLEIANLNLDKNFENCDNFRFIVLYLLKVQNMSAKCVMFKLVSFVC